MPNRSSNTARVIIIGIVNGQGNIDLLKGEVPVVVMGNLK